MGQKLYCHRYAHFKDPVVCSVVCPYRTRCQDFALYYDANRESVDALVGEYFAARRETPPQPARHSLSQAVGATQPLRALIRLEVKQEMAEAAYIWIGKDDQAELLELEEIIKRAERGSKAKHIYKVAQEMELRFQLVPRKRIEKAKRIVAAEQERAAARRSRPRPVALESHTTAAAAPLSIASASGETHTAAAPTRRRRSRLAKASGE
ncbi:MAG: hypothetical protein JOZ52_02025 [Acidobacteria bacterium]|nr:hypothetical protein [Acidobacteriota bacterium]